MSGAIALRDDYTSDELRTLACRVGDVRQSRRLLSLAAVYDGMSRAQAAKIGAMDRQTLRNWVHRFNDLERLPKYLKRDASPNALKSLISGSV